MLLPRRSDGDLRSRIRWGEGARIRTLTRSGHGSARRLVCREQREAAAAQGPERAEVALVEGEQTLGVMTLGGDDDTEVSEASIDVLVPTFELRDDTMVVRLQMSDDEPSGSQIFDETETSSTPQTTTKQVVHFRSDGSGDDQLAWLLSEHQFDRRPKAVPSVGDGDERSRVDDDRQSPKPSRSSRAGTSAMEPPGPSPMPNSTKLRSPLRSGS